MITGPQLEEAIGWIRQDLLQEAYSDFLALELEDAIGFRELKRRIKAVEVVFDQIQFRAKQARNK
jgi:uncharacterized protein with ACT and thioredoxin-like domain